MAGIGMLMFVGGIVLVIQITLVVIFLISSGISVGVIGIIERKRQAKLGVKNPVHIIMTCYGFLIAAVVIGFFFYIFVIDISILEYLVSNYTIILKDIADNFARRDVFFWIGMMLEIAPLSIGVSFIVIGVKEQKRVRKCGKTRPAHTFLIIYGIILLSNFIDILLPIIGSIIGFH